jgi:S-DNA-T family DNA segregation ATPase FtsK/SpoIIIE
VTVGRADVPSALRLTPERGGAERPEVLRLREKARVLPAAPLTVNLRRGLCVLGGGAGADALVRSVVLQALCRIPPPARIDVAGPAEAWLPTVPHRVARLPRPGDAAARIVLNDGGPPATVVRGLPTDHWPSDCETVVTVGTAAARVLRHPEVSPGVPFTPDAVSTIEATQLARALAAGSRETDGGIPDRAGLATLLDAAAPSGGGPAAGSLRCPLGVGAAVSVEVDLVADGPHAVIGGTTGSGKSELLRTWVLALARLHPPDRVQFLLLDFKGGATFHGLDRLPHTAGVLTDLDVRTVRRAVAGIRAELMRRERVLAAAAARSVDEAGGSGLARLVLVVDEFAALAEQLPECHAVLGDVAARGRSLGVHLILCTQRPAGVVRDALLANAGLRICLRVTSDEDSRAVVGVPDAARLDRPGRAILATAGSPRMQFQVAEADPGLPARVAGTWAPHAGTGHSGARGGDGPGTEPTIAAHRPWLPELPTRIDLAELPPGDGLVFGLADRPDLQARLPAAWTPDRDGALLVLGAPRSGRSAALAAVSGAAGAPETIRPRPTLPCVWDAVGEALRRLDEGERRPALLLLDDIDAVLAAAGADYGHELAERVLRVLRSGAAVGVAVALTAARIPSALGGASALAGCRLLLRAASREDHLLAGGSASTFDPSAPPGRGELGGVLVQVGSTDRTFFAPPEQAERLDPVPLGLLAVSSRPADLASILGAGAQRLGTADPATHPPGSVLVGTPDEWQIRWSSLRSLAATRPVLLDGLAPGEVRSLLGRPELPPPCSARPRWLLQPGEPSVRVRLPDAR